MKKCSKCKKDLKAVVKIEKQLQLMHRDFRKIMDRINDTNARENLNKFAKLLTEIEKVSSTQFWNIFKPFLFSQVCKMPSKEQITCQQILLQCFAALGNCHVEFSDSTEIVTFSGNTNEDYDEEDDDDDDEMPGLI